MKKIKYLLILLLIISFKNVSAIDNCTSSEMTRLRELANNVEIKYEPKIDEIASDDSSTIDTILVSYRLVVSNLANDLRLYYKSGNNEKKLITMEQLQNETFYEGMNIQFQIYSWTNNLCTDELLRTINIKFPSYSRFYYFHKEECNKYPDFKYCKEFLDISSINFDDDIDKVEEAYNNYLKDKGVIQVNDDIQVNNYILIVISIAVLLIIIISIVLINKKNKKKKDDL